MCFGVTLTVILLFKIVKATSLAKVIKKPEILDIKMNKRRLTAMIGYYGKIYFGLYLLKHIFKT